MKCDLNLTVTSYLRTGSIFRSFSRYKGLFPLLINGTVILHSRNTYTRSSFSC